MDEQEASSSSDFSTSSLEDLAPKIQKEFANLSSVLLETNQNIHTFEFMLNQYRQLAAVPPIVSQNQPSTDDDHLNASQIASSAKLQTLLADLSEAVDKVALLKEHLRLEEGRETLNEASILKSKTISDLQSENQSLQIELKSSRSEIEIMRERLKVLEQNLASQSQLCDQLRESAHRSRQLLEEERNRSSKLDQKLDIEKKAAEKVGQDINKYVSRMQDLEREIAEAKREKKTKAKNPAGEPVINMHGDTLSVHYPAEDDLADQLRRLTLELNNERSARVNLEAENLVQEEKLNESKKQLNDLRQGLESLEEELARCQGLSIAYPSTLSPISIKTGTNTEAEQPDVRTVNDLSKTLSKREKDFQSLKSKSEILLKKYKERKSAHLALKLKIKGILSSLLESLASAEQNYRCILSHLGSEIEISTRLMAAYLHISVKHSPVQLLHRSLSGWFNDIQALSTWLQKQILCFGQRCWTDREPGIQSKHLVAFPAIPVPQDPENTFDDVSEALSSKIVEISKDKSICDLVRGHENAILDGNRLVQTLLKEI